MRLCLKCRIEKPLDQFYKHATRGYQSYCIPCKKADAKTDKSKARYAKNYQDNKERRDAQAVEWVKKNPERSRAIKRSWSQRNPENARKQAKRYAKRHPDKVLERNKRRRARERGAPGDYSRAEWFACLARWDYECAYCTLPFTSDRLPTQDHMLPLTRGGHHVDANIVPACRSCNSRKRTRTAEEFIKIAGLDESLLFTLTGQ